MLPSCLRSRYLLNYIGKKKTLPFLLSKTVHWSLKMSLLSLSKMFSFSAEMQLFKVISGIQIAYNDEKTWQEYSNWKWQVRWTTFSKCCWRWHSTWALAAVFPTGMSAGNFRGVPISSSASAPRKTLSSKSPTVRTYSSYSLFSALLEEKPKHYIKS